MHSTPSASELSVAVDNVIVLDRHRLRATRMQF